MDLTMSPELEAWRQEVKDFLAEELPPEMAGETDFREDPEFWEFAREFTRRVGAKKWVGLTWPEKYGGLERPRIEQMILNEEFGDVKAPLVNRIGWGLAANSILLVGTEEQKHHYLPKIQSLEMFWAEGLSEPDAGSDLASLQTTAVRDGDNWVVNGQKTFTTWGTHADYLLLAARTDPDAPKHKGISVFCLDLHSEGVSFAPLDNIAGGRQNHTFLDNVRIPADSLIGDQGMGWPAIMNSFYGGGGYGGGAQRLLRDMVTFCKETERYGKALSEDPVIRGLLAELAIMLEAQKLLAWEGLSLAESGGRPVFAGAIGPVVHKEYQPRIAQICMEIVGPLGQIRSGKWAPFAGEIENRFMRSFGNHAGGTPQVKRMVLATRGLGLPR